MSEIELKARNLLASCLNEWGCHQEAGNVRDGDDLESYEFELRLIGQLLRFGFETGSGREAAALTPPEGYVLVPAELPDMGEAPGFVEGHYSRSNWRAAIADLQWLAARPEVP